MVNLLDFIGTNVVINKNQQMWTKVIFFMHIGDGIFKKLEPSHIIFSGDINSMVYKGTFYISIEIINDTEVKLILNDITYNGTYYVKNHSLYISASYNDNKENLVLNRINNKTYLSSSGVINNSIELR